MSGDEANSGQCPETKAGEQCGGLELIILFIFFICCILEPETGKYQGNSSYKSKRIQINAVLILS